MIYLSSFLLGIGSSWHCLGMCGPLVMSVPFPKKQQSFASKSTYFLGKAFAYALLGIVVGSLGLKAIWGDSQRYISITAGAFIVLMVIFPYLVPKTFKYPFKKTFTKIFNQMKERPKLWHFLSLGFLNGLLPCGMVYMALFVALASGNVFDAAIAMLLFGFGTTPVLWFVALIKDKLRNQLQAKFKMVTVSLGLLAGFLLIFRGLNLGIPYLSPHLDTTEQIAKTDSGMHEGMHCH